MNEFTKRFLIGYAVWVAISVGDTVARSINQRKVRKAHEKEMENLKREQEKGIIDVEDYVVYPA